MLFEDRASYDEMLEESWDGTDESRKAGEALVAKLRDAEQAHEAWAAAELEALLLDGATARCRRWHDARHPRVKTTDGKSIRSSGGARGRDAETGVLDGTYRQLAFEDMERPQLYEYALNMERGSATLKADAAGVRRLLRTLDRAPEAKTPREACEALGLDVHAVLAGEVAV